MQIGSTEVLNQVVTACFTVFGGVTVFVLGQLFTKFFIEPIHDQSKLRGEIAYSLTFYSNVYGNASVIEKDIVNNASNTLRGQASHLRASVCTIRWYWLWQLLRIVPKRKNVIKASTNLIGLSNSMHPVNFDPSGTEKREAEIRKLLGLN